MTPDIISFSAAVTACDRCDKWAASLSLLSRIFGSRLVPDTVLFNSVLHCLESPAQWRIALSLLRDMPSRSVLANEMSYRSVMGACQDWKLAVELWGEMSVASEPSAISASTAVLVCARQGAWRVALVILQDMLSLGFPDGPSAFSGLIEACDRDGRWAAAARLLDDWAGPVALLCRDRI